MFLAVGNKLDIHFRKYSVIMPSIIEWCYDCITMQYHIFYVILFISSQKELLKVMLFLNITQALIGLLCASHFSLNNSGFLNCLVCQVAGRCLCHPILPEQVCVDHRHT